MPNIVNVLNEQIRRLSRRELYREIRNTRKLTAQHRRDLAALKRQVAALQKTVDFLERQEKRRVAQQPVPATEEKALRFRADGLRTHRAKTGLSAGDYAKLIGVSGQSIYNWEAGTSRPRPAQIKKLAALRSLGKREILKRLALLNGKREA